MIAWIFLVIINYLLNEVHESLVRLFRVCFFGRMSVTTLPHHFIESTSFDYSTRRPYILIHTIDQPLDIIGDPPYLRQDLQSLVIRIASRIVKLVCISYNSDPNGKGC